jgi:hypothetical protein
MLHPGGLRIDITRSEVMKIVVIGGTGLIGSNAIKKLKTFTSFPA